MFYVYVYALYELFFSSTLLCIHMRLSCVFYNKHTYLFTSLNCFFSVVRQCEVKSFQSAPEQFSQCCEHASNLLILSLQF